MEDSLDAVGCTPLERFILVGPDIIFPEEVKLLVNQFTLFNFWIGYSGGGGGGDSWEMKEI